MVRSTAFCTSSFRIKTKGNANYSWTVIGWWPGLRRPINCCLHSQIMVKSCTDSNYLKFERSAKHNKSKTQELNTRTEINQRNRCALILIFKDTSVSLYETWAKMPSIERPTCTGTTNKPNGQHY